MKNEGTIDRILRAVVAVVLFAVAMTFGGFIGVVLIVLSVIMLFTAITGFCALYKLFGIDTSKK